MSRSYLFIPGNTPAMIQNLDVFESDCIIIDLEDSVTVNDKDAARILVSTFLDKFKFKGIEIYVRINDSESTFFLDDIKAMDHLDLNGYVLPKASIESLNSILKVTDKFIIPIIESPMAVLNMESIAKEKQIKGILLGAEDLTKELGISRTTIGTEILFTRSKLVLVANAYGIDSIDTPFTQKDNLEELVFDSLNAKNLGFTSKSVIHPNHVETINEVFSPSADEINQALRIVKKAEKELKGAFSLDGKMVDLPIIEKAKKLLEKAKKYNLL